MKKTLLFLLAVIAFPVYAEEKKCDIGPVSRTFASTEWVIYSCADNSTLVVATAPGNPAMPFYFTIYADDKGYHVYGEGTGNKDITDKVVVELQKLSNSDIAEIIKDTKAIKK